jgi:hypothetical protein
MALRSIAPGTMIPSALLLAAALTAAPALAQVAPPPPKAPEKTPEYVPPQPTERPAPASQRRGRQPASQNDVKLLGSGTPLPDIPYEPLVKLDESGKIIPLEVPSEYAATKNNPTTKGPIAQAMLAHFIHERQLQFEEILIENLDLALEIEAGYFEQADYSDRAVMGTISQRVRPLAPPTAFGKEAEAKEVLTRMQAQFNTKIAKEYDTAVMREARAKMNAGDPAGAGLVMGPVMRSSVSESLYAYKRLCADLAANVDAVVGKLTLETDGQAALTTFKTELAAATDEAAKIAAAKKFIAALPLETAQQALRTTRDVRPPAVLPEIPEIKPLDGMDPALDQEDVKEMRREQQEKAERIRTETAEGKRPFTGDDGKFYFKNPDGTDRLATEEELAAFRTVREAEIAEEKARKELRRQEKVAELEARKAKKLEGAPAPQPAPTPEPK